MEMDLFDFPSNKVFPVKGDFPRIRSLGALLSSGKPCY